MFLLSIFTDSHSMSERDSEERTRKKGTTTQFTSLPNVNQKTSAQDGQFQNTGDPGQVRARCFTMPTRWGTNNQQTTENMTPGID